VTCPNCQGFSDHDIYGRRAGTSCGRNLEPEAIALFGSKCPTCHGDAYVVPITVRPVAKGGEITNFAESADDVPKHLRRQRWRRSPVAAPESPEALIASLQETEPLVAVAAVVLLGEYGDRWAKHASGIGRSFSIWPIVSAGQQIIREARATSTEEDWYTRQIDIIWREIEPLWGSDEAENVRLRTLREIATGQALMLEAKVDAAVGGREAA
jgi:hypothetical protein